MPAPATAATPAGVTEQRLRWPAAPPEVAPPPPGAPLWLALRLPALPLEALMRADGRAGPVAVLAADGGHARVVACSEAASQAGVRAGMRHGGALALCPALQALRRDPEAEARALEGLAAWAGQFTSRVSLEPADALLLEVGASLTLFGGLDALLEHIEDGLRELGYGWCRGVAPTPTAALLLADAGMPTPVRLRQALPAALSSVPVRCLPLSADVIASLEGMGVRRFGDCLRLPRDGLGRRLGAALTELMDRALARRPDPRADYHPPPRFERALGLPAEMDDRDMLLLAAGRLLLEMGGMLRALGAGVQQVELRFVHRGLPPSRVRLGLLQPSRDVHHLQALLRERLQLVELPAGVVQVELRAGRLLPLAPAELSLFAVTPRAAEDLGPLLDRLRVRLGEEAVQGLAVVTAHRPEHAWEHCEPGARSLAARFPSRPLWLLTTPEPLALEDGWPACGGPLRIGDGPERIESGWWDGGDVARDYYTAENPHGERFWIYRDLREPETWYLHGVFG